MARKPRGRKAKPKPKTSEPGPLKRWWFGMADARRSAIIGASVRLVLLAVCVAAGAWGLTKLQAYMMRDPRFSRNDAYVQLEDPPVWMTEWGLERDLCDAFDDALAGDNWTFDPGLPRRVHDIVKRCPWVRRIHHVRVERLSVDDSDRFGRLGRVVVSAEWRRPVAIGVYRDREEYVDIEGVVLPRYRVNSLRLPRIIGQALAPPPVGQQWQGQDVQAALTLLYFLREKPYYSEVTGVDVSNWSRRNNLSAPDIELKVANGRETTDIRFGELVLSEMPSVRGEPSLERKIGYLDGWYRRNHSRLAGPTYLDLRNPDNLRCSNDYALTGTQ